MKNARKAVKETATKFRSFLQPSGPNATSSPAPSLPPNPAKIDGLRQATANGLTSALQALHTSADLIPPLKVAIGKLIDCLSIVEDTASNSKDYRVLTSKLTTVTRTLNEYLGELGLEVPVGDTSCERIALSIEEEVEHIRERQNRSKIKRALSSYDDHDDIIQRYRRVEELFVQLQNDISLQTLKSSNRQHTMALLTGLAPVDDARYNSSYSAKIDRRGCTKDTREQVQEDLQYWVQDPDGANVYWMNGMAGTGKTTIAYSLCEWLEANRQLGASFFCSRTSASCRNVDLIIPTIAYGLARYSPAFQRMLCKVLERDPGASKLNIVQQFKQLIENPLQAGSQRDKPLMLVDVVVVIDALDECEDDDGVRLVLQLLLGLSKTSHLKFFVTSRPEPTIRDIMLSSSRYPPAVLHLHDIEQWIVEGDIKKYLTEGFESISPRPTDRQIEQLTKLTGKLFIYAATVTRYIVPGKAAVNSIARLDAVLKASSQMDRQATSNKKYRQLDELYNTILAIALDDINLEKEEIKAIRLVLWTVVCAAEPMTVPTLSAFLSLAQEQVSSALQPLRSVLHVSEPGELVSVFHASFPDYILDSARSGQFCCRHTEHNELITNLCFELMKDQLRFNICKFETSNILDKDVPDLEQRITRNIPPALFHACMHWGGYLRLTGASNSLYDRLVDFLSHRLLFWMEVLNVRQSIAKGITILFQAEKWLSEVPGKLPTARQLAFDANDFVARFVASKCRGSTPHIYISALPLCTKFSLVYANYWGRTRGLIDLQGTVANRKSILAQAAWMVDAPVHSVAISFDGDRIISGDSDGNIHVRDGQTGDLVGIPFAKYYGAVRSIALSPDGTRIASGFDAGSKHAIRIWDASTGDATVEPFGLFLGTVSSVAFSPDGERIVSSSDTCTVRLWDANTGDAILSCSGKDTRLWGIVTGSSAPFEGHTGWVTSVAFSPNGERIVSGSEDKTLRMWDASTGDLVVEPCCGHTDRVNSVAFSPSGNFIASGSNDMTVRVWGARTGHNIAGPFRGHTSSIYSVQFSRDGSCVASGAENGTLRVWNARTGDTVAGPFRGHTGAIHSVVFSPDGTRIISGSGDQSIRVWGGRNEPFTSERHFRDRSHIHVPSHVVGFSRDGTSIISGSADGKAQVRNACTGELIKSLHYWPRGSIESVASSADGSWAAITTEAGFVDLYINVWSAQNDKAMSQRIGSREDSSEKVSDTQCSTTSQSSAQPRIVNYSISTVALSPDTKRIAIGCDDGDIWLRDTRTGKFVADPFRGHTQAIRSIAFSPDSTRLASGSEEKSLVWNILTGDVVAGPSHSNTTSIAFSNDGTRLASGSCGSFQPGSGYSDRGIWVWDSITGNLIAGPFQGHTDAIQSVVFSPDCSRIISGSLDKTIRVWVVGTGGATTLKGHTSSVKSVAVSPNGKSIVSSSRDHVIRVWDLDSDAEDFEVNRDGWVTNSSGLLFWAPPDFHTHLPHPRSSLLIGPEGTVFIDYKNLLVGERWGECCVP